MSRRDLDEADHLLDLRRPTEAEQRARAHLGEDPGSAEALRLLARALGMQDRWHDALAAARAAVAADPQESHGHILVSNALAHLDDVAGAVEAARAAVALDPGWWATHYHLAWALTRGRRPRTRDAFQSARHAVSLAPAQPEPHNLVGICLESLGDHVGARRAYVEALRLDPQHAAARQNLATLDLSERRLTHATRGMTAALSLDPQDQLMQRNFQLLLQTLLRWFYGVILVGGILLGIVLLVDAPYPVRALVGAAVLGVDVWVFVRVTRHFPRALRRPSRQMLHLLGWFLRLQVLVVAVVTVVIVLMAFAPSETARSAGLLMIPIVRGALIGTVIFGIVGAIIGRRD